VKKTNKNTGTTLRRPHTERLMAVIHTLKWGRGAQREGAGPPHVGFLPPTSMFSPRASTGGKWMQLASSLVQGKKFTFKGEISYFLQIYVFESYFFISPSFLAHGSHLQFGLGVPKSLMFVHHFTAVIVLCSCLMYSVQHHTVCQTFQINPLLNSARQNTLVYQISVPQVIWNPR